MHKLLKTCAAGHMWSSYELIAVVTSVYCLFNIMKNHFGNTFLVMSIRQFYIQLIESQKSVVPFHALDIALGGRVQGGKDKIS